MTNRMDPRQQFSKRLAWWTSLFWFFYMTWLSVVIYLQPASALYCVYMGINVTAVMLLNVWAYTKNSVYEKGALAMLDKAKIEFSLRNGKNASTSDEEDDGETEVSNG